MINTHLILTLDGKGQRSEWEQFHGVDAARSKRQPSNPVTADRMAASEPAYSWPVFRRRRVEKSLDRYIIQQS
jgi:hypothetical protein